MSARKAHKRATRQKEAVARQEFYDTLTEEEKTNKSNEWKKNVKAQRPVT